MQTATTNPFGNPCVLSKRTTLFTHEVLYFEGDINYTYIHLTSGKHKLLSKTLLSIENQVDAAHFIRISRKHIVNKKFIAKMGRSFVVLTNGKILTVSRRRRGVLVL